MDMKNFIQSGGVPFGGANGQFIISIKNALYSISTRKKDYEFNAESLIKLRESTVYECESMIRNHDHKTAYSHLVSTFNAVSFEADKIFKWKNELEIENTHYSEIWVTCEDLKAYIIGLIIDHYPEKLKNPKLIEAALLLPKYSHHRLIAEQYLKSKNSENNKNGFTIEQFQILFNALKQSKQIIHNADEKTFLNICLGVDIPHEKRIKWIGSRKNCFAFMMDLRCSNIRANEVNRSFQQWRVNVNKGVVNSKDLQRNDQSNAIHTNYIKNLLKGYTIP
jgi:hypothetical protein